MYALSEKVTKFVLSVTLHTSVIFYPTPTDPRHTSLQNLKQNERNEDRKN